MDLLDPLSRLDPMNLIDPLGLIDGDPAGIRTSLKEEDRRPPSEAVAFARLDIDLGPALRHAVGRETEAAGYDDPVEAAANLFNIGGKAASRLCEWLGYEPREGVKQAVKMVSIGGSEFEAGSALAKNARALEALPPPFRVPG